MEVNKPVMKPQPASPKKLSKPSKPVNGSPVKKLSSNYRIDELSRFEKELMFSSSKYSKVESPSIQVKLQPSPVKIIKPVVKCTDKEIKPLQTVPKITNSPKIASSNTQE